MGLMGRVMSGLNAAVAAYREAFTNADTLDADILSGDALDSWGQYEARRLRYAMAWAFYQNTAYRDLHTWARRHKSDHGIYEHARNLYCPVKRGAEFWSCHLMGGPLDAEAGDGRARRSALPIEGASDPLRKVIARTWADSEWQVYKGVLGRFGALMGDVAIKVVDCRRAGKVRLQVIHPKHIRWVQQCPITGEVLSYIQQELRFDPEADQAGLAVAPWNDPRARQRLVTYTERVTLDGANVVFETYKEGKLYAWPGQDQARWTEPYGFVPLVMIQHTNVGLDWGMSAFHSENPKIIEVDDQASKLSDQIRKAVHPRWMYAGVKRADLAADRGGKAPTRDNPEPSRTELDGMYVADPQARPHALVFDLKIAEVLEHIQDLIRELERDLPELAMDIWGTGDPSGIALRIARQRVETKAQEVRSGYDSAMRRAQQMAVAIGGRGDGTTSYPGYEGFSIDSIASGAADHTIGERAVFAVDPLFRLEEEGQLWTNATAAVAAGVPLPYFLEREGWTDEDLAALDQARQKAEAEAQARLDAQAAAGGTPSKDGTPPAAGGPDAKPEPGTDKPV